MRLVRAWIGSTVKSAALATAVGLALGLGAAGGVLAPRAEAQMRVGMGPGMGMGQGRVTKADLAQYGRIVNFTDAQKAAAEDLLSAYDAEYDKARKTFMDKLDQIRQDFQDNQDPSVWQKDLPAASEAFQNKTTDLEKSLLGDIKTLLTPEQQARWPKVERANRRNHSLPGGMLSGEGVDLTQVVDGLKLKDLPEPVSQALDRYETELDAAIQERDAQRKTIGEKMQSSMGRGGMPDFQEMQKNFTELRKTGLKVRDLNDRYASLIQGGLSDAAATDFADKVKRAKFPQIYREPYAVKAMTAAKDFKDLDADKKESVEQLLASYQRDAQALNDKWARLQWDAEKDGGGDDQMAPWMRMMNGDQGGDTSELGQTRKARRKLDTDTMDKLKALLTEEQIERLPERDNNGMFQWGGGRNR